MILTSWIENGKRVRQKLFFETNKMYAHKLDSYGDEPHKKVVFCVVCGRDTDLAGPCPGEYVPTPEQQAIIDKQFREIFSKDA